MLTIFQFGPARGNIAFQFKQYILKYYIGIPTNPE